VRAGPAMARSRQVRRCHLQRIDVDRGGGGGDRDGQGQRRERGHAIRRPDGAAASAPPLRPGPMSSPTARALW
jgi:hypothetical protein